MKYFSKKELNLTKRNAIICVYVIDAGANTKTVNYKLQRILMTNLLYYALPVRSALNTIFVFARFHYTRSAVAGHMETFQKVVLRYQPVSTPLTVPG